MASQITGDSTVCLTVCFGEDQIKHQSCAALDFVGESTGHRWIPLTKGQQCGKCFHLMTSSCVLSSFVTPYTSMGRNTFLIRWIFFIIDSPAQLVTRWWLDVLWLHRPPLSHPALLAGVLRDGSLRPAEKGSGRIQRQLTVEKTRHCYHSCQIRRGFPGRISQPGVVVTYDFW